MAGYKHDRAKLVTQRVLRVVVSITLSLAVMGLIAYGFGRATHTEWVWWLAPLTVALDASFPFRARVHGSAALLSLSEIPILRDKGTPIFLASSVVAAVVAAWGAYTGNRFALIIGAAFAILGRAFECSEEPALD
jgi:hypothetical protein